MLVAAGVVVNAPDNRGYTALHTAPNGEVAAALIAAGAKVDASSLYGEQPLHLARRGCVVRALVAAGRGRGAEHRDVWVRACVRVCLGGVHHTSSLCWLVTGCG